MNIGEEGEIAILHGRLVERVESEHVSSSCERETETMISYGFDKALLVESECLL